MRHLEKFNEHSEQKNIDYDEINNQLIEKFKENNLEPSIDNIYADFEILRKDKINSFVFQIVKQYLKDTNQDFKVQNIMRNSAKFFEFKYGDIINKYREERKKEFEIENKKIKGKILLPYNGELIKVPSRIGHNYIPLKILPLEEIHTKYSRHKRLKTFHHKGLKCVRCDRVGEYLIAAKDKGGQIHLDIYTKDFELMTVDHIKPKSLGGSYDIENLDPMCTFCNSEKSNKYETEEILDSE